MPGVQPWPVVLFDGVWQSCLVIDLFTDPVVLDGLEIDWGRDEYMNHTGVGTLVLSWIDRTGQLAARMREKRMLGSQILVQWADGLGTGATMFQGRITGAAAEPDVPDPWATDPEARCWRVTVHAADKTADLGNIIQPASTWPRETMQARAAALNGASFIAGIQAFYFYPGHTDSVAWALDVKGRDNLSLLRDFYYSMGDTFTYLPAENVCRYLYRRAYHVWANLVQYDDGLIRMTANDQLVDGQRTYRGVGIQGCDVTSDDEAAVPINSAVTRVEASWKDTQNNDTDVVTTVYADEQSELDRGRRTLTFTSWLGDGLRLDPVVLEVLNRGRFEGSQPKHPNITRDTRRTNGFYSRGEARALLAGGETNAVLYVSGSQYAMWLFQVPFYAVIGGKIRWEHPGWIIDLNVQFHLATNTITPVRWNQMTNSLAWYEPPTVGAIVDSMTWFDAAFLQTGNVYVPTEI